MQHFLKFPGRAAWAEVITPELFEKLNAPVHDPFAAHNACF
jgi:hypothetical protein